MALPTANMNEGKTRSVGVNHATGMIQWSIRRIAVTWRVYNDHKTNSFPEKHQGQ